MNSFCTIVTKSHLVYVRAIYNSIKSLCGEVNMAVLVTDTTSSGLNEIDDLKELNLVEVSRICDQGVGLGIFEKYHSVDMDKFRWSMKPVLMTYLLNEGYDKVIYIDSDIFFYQDPSFLFSKLEDSNIIITPHWRTMNPADDFVDFKRNNTHGIFNGGFVGSNKKGLKALDWWASSCEYACVNDRANGLCDDQSYLNLFPVLFEKVEVIKHKGCNVANWNRRVCKRTFDGESVKINGAYPIVFIHMTVDTMRGAFNGEDPHLTAYVEEYSEAIHALNPVIDIVEKYSKRKKVFGIF